jgi:hypothetical protein
VSAAVCLDAWSHRVTACVAPERSTDGVPAAAAHAPTAPRPTSPHARRSQFQLHSRPPRQRLPSSLVIESAAALPSACTRSFRAAALPMNASDYSGVIRLWGASASPSVRFLCGSPTPTSSFQTTGIFTPTRNRTDCRSCRRATGYAGRFDAPFTRQTPSLLLVTHMFESSLAARNSG